MTSLYSLSRFPRNSQLKKIFGVIFPTWGIYCQGPGFISVQADLASELCLDVIL